MPSGTSEQQRGAFWYLRIIEGIIVVVAALYFGRPVLLPLAMAVLLAFLLSPAVTWFERRRFHRVAAVGVVMVLISGMLAVAGWKISGELLHLAENWSDYRQNLPHKIRDLASPGVLSMLGETVSEVTQEIEGKTVKVEETVVKTETVPVDPAAPQAVRIVPEPTSSVAAASVAISTIAGPFAASSIVIILVIFMLIDRENLRNRIVRLMGTGRVTLTTMTLDDLGGRISRYLLMNTLVNCGFGFVIFIGLQLLGVHYAILWGFLAAALRFVPYVGPVLASILPIGMALIQFPTWWQPIAVAAMFVALELITNNVVEPLIYGKSAGISTMALLLAAIFWAWIWGPVGLVLSVPLTVMVAVLGKYIPPLEPLWILLGDEAPLSAHVQYYQRLLAADPDEAANVLEEYGAARTPIEIYDDALIPALALAERDRERGDLPETTQQFIWQTTQDIVLDSPEIENQGTIGKEQTRVDPPQTLRRVYIVGAPVHDKADELALNMLSRVVPENVELHSVPLITLASELLESLRNRMPDLVCISALGPGGVGQTRYLCKRLRQTFPELKILVGRWGYRGDKEKMSTNMRAAADEVVTSLAEAVQVILRVQPQPGVTAAPAVESIPQMV